MNKPLDKMDKNILKILQEDGRITNKELSKAIGLSPAPTLERVKKLEREFYIEGFHAEINKRKLGITVEALIMITLLHQKESQIHKFIEGVMNIPEVVECYQVTGDYDYHLKVYALDISYLDQLITQRISRIPEVAHIKSHIILNRVKRSRHIPFLLED